MVRISGLMAAGCSLALCASQAWATDFFIQPTSPGPVAGAPLGAIALQATTAEAEPELVEEPVETTDSTPFKRLRTTVNDRGNTAGKWLRPGSETVTATAAEEVDATTDATSASVTEDTGATDETAVTAATAEATTTQITAVASTTGNTWKSVADAFASGQIKAGDRILLMAGYHGPISIRGANFATPVTIAPVPGQVAHAASITVRSSSGLNFQDLKVWTPAGATLSANMVRTYPDSSNITFTRLDVRAVADSPNYLKWSQTTWLANKTTGFLTDGDKIVVRNNRITGVFHGILSMGRNGVVEANIVDGFGGDGMRALGDYSLVKGNRIQNCFDIDPNHDDGFQSFSRSAAGKAGAGTLYGLKLIGNKIIEWNLQTTNPLRCNLQGIGMFDGMFEDLLIENNVIAVSHYHGITVTGTRKAVIRNNTVVNVQGKAGKYPMILVANDKDGTQSTNITLANNLAMSIRPLPTGAVNSVVTNNQLIALGSDFASIAAKDYSLSATSKAVDGGQAKYAPTVDVLNAPRPKGAAPDIGAFETR